MEKTNLVLLGLIGVVVIGLVFAGVTTYNKGSSKEDFDSNDETNSKSLSFEEKVSEGQITITLKPVGIRDKKLYVESIFDTHSGNLGDYDLMKLVTLEYDEKIVSPSSVPELAWHHGEDNIIFDIDGSIPEKFTIKVKEVPDVNERIFSWP